MNDVTGKPIRLRTATAQGSLAIGKAAREAVETATVPKGNPFEIAKAAGLIAIKKTPDLIPHCHPVAIDGAEFKFSLSAKDEGGIVLVQCLVKSIARTGPEMEALQGVSSALLVIYDLLKPIDTNLEIQSIRLVEKTGGKSDPRNRVRENLRASIFVISDAVTLGKKEDGAGPIIKQMIEKAGIAVARFEVLSSDRDLIEKKIKTSVDESIPFILLLGGTGIAPHESTADIVERLAERSVPGIAEMMRSHGMEITPLAMFSRSYAGVLGLSLIVAMPGSSSGAKQSLEAILPAVFQAHRMLAKKKDEGGRRN